VSRSHFIPAFPGILNDAIAVLVHELSGAHCQWAPIDSSEEACAGDVAKGRYSFRSERWLIRRPVFDRLCGRLVGVGVDEAAWDHPTFRKNCQRLLLRDFAAKLLVASWPIDK
jgi:hypothetical protein